MSPWIRALLVAGRLLHLYNSQQWQLESYEGLRTCVSREEYVQKSYLYLILLVRRILVLGIQVGMRHSSLCSSEFVLNDINTVFVLGDRLCGLVVRVSGY
jgi:hypothetical protein